MLRRKPTRIELDTQNEAKKFVDDQKLKLENKRKEADQEKIRQGVLPPKRSKIDERIGYNPTD